MKFGACDHIRSVEIKEPKQLACSECVKTNDKWVHLRTCQTCGVTLCCDSSPNKHASAHAHQENHPVIRSAEPNEHWLYCYMHDTLKD